MTLLTLPLLSVLLTVSSGAPAPRSASSGSPASPATLDASLAPLAWLAGGRWVATTDDPKAPVMLRESFFEWSPNGQALRFWSFATDRQFLRRPYVEGWYVFHPGRKQIVFSYVDPGAFYSGDVGAQEGALDHVFEGVSKAGAVRKYRYILARGGADEMTVRIFDQSGGGEWRQIVELVYRRQPY